MNIFLILFTYKIIKIQNVKVFKSLNNRFEKYIMLNNELFDEMFNYGNNKGRWDIIINIIIIIII